MLSSLVQSGNRYGYCIDIPVKKKDTTGFLFEDVFDNDVWSIKNDVYLIKQTV